MNWDKALNRLANVTIVLASIAVLWLSFRPSRSERNAATVGDVLAHDALPTIKGPTLLIGLQIGCIFCEESAPFYRQVREHSNGCAGIDVAAVVKGTPDEVRAYAARKGLGFSVMPATDLAPLRIAATPTILLLDADRTVIQIWRGKLSPEAERSVLDLVDRSCGRARGES